MQGAPRRNGRRYRDEVQRRRWPLIGWPEGGRPEAFPGPAAVWATARGRGGSGATPDGGNEMRRRKTDRWPEPLEGAAVIMITWAGALLLAVMHVVLWLV